MPQESWENFCEKLCQLKRSLPLLPRRIRKESRRRFQVLETSQTAGDCFSALVELIVTADKFLVRQR